MKKALLLSQVIMLLIFLAMNSYAAGEPNLLTSNPANGATNVSISTEKIQFFFDKNMKMNRWSLIKTLINTHLHP